ncbi:hypothetical protein FA09DRAFT_75309 [Tilletiopsis washingtonensis]|uniref:Uncharacterized protein n=1 Tax=Tilletiopsis washingtonensis TaxID=58919 RepID=A0A316Z5U9_9BASI|nr:hypothetical protein FA09DRAFT_75309 [Tilletiopsis washingtonensis]PWN96989.1 hypothetical protein FA09DRAFT_75309 [Tilletiopsis washingtonensis]
MRSSFGSTRSLQTTGSRYSSPGRVLSTSSDGAASGATAPRSGSVGASRTSKRLAMPRPSQMTWLTASTTYASSEPGAVTRVTRQYGPARRWASQRSCSALSSVSSVVPECDAPPSRSSSTSSTVHRPSCQRGTRARASATEALSRGTPARSSAMRRRRWTSSGAPKELLETFAAVMMTGGSPALSRARQKRS